MPTPEQSAYIGIVDEWAIYDASCTLAILINTGENHPPEKLIEDVTPYLKDTAKTISVKPLNDPDFIGADAALRRASAKAIAKARAAGLEPIVSNPEDLPKRLP